MRAVVISFAASALLAAYERELGLPLAFFADPDREAYAAFGFARASTARVWLHPRVWARYARLVARGRRLRSPVQDTLQLGGDVLADAEGRVRWIYASAGPEDRPSPGQLAAARRDAAGLGASPPGG